MTRQVETRVRDAAAALHDAILDARKAGLRVMWPAAPAGLPNIAISATAEAVGADPVPKATPVAEAGSIAAAVAAAKRRKA